MATDRHFFVITLQWVSPNGSNNVHTHTDAIAIAGRTRQQVFVDIFQRVARDVGAPLNRTTVLFFSLEPNRLSDS